MLESMIDVSYRNRVLSCFGRRVTVVGVVVGGGRDGGGWCWWLLFLWLPHLLAFPRRTMFRRYLNLCSHRHRMLVNKKW